MAKRAKATPTKRPAKSKDPEIIFMSQDQFQELINQQAQQQPQPLTEEQRFRANLAIDQLRSTNHLNWATADREHAAAFQLRANSLLNGMAEIRLALNFPSVDSSKEHGQERPALKEIFESQKERDQLKVRYGQLLDIFYRVMKTIDVKQEQPREQ